MINLILEGAHIIFVHKCILFGHPLILVEGSEGVTFFIGTSVEVVKQTQALIVDNTTLLYSTIEAHGGDAYGTQFRNFSIHYYSSIHNIEDYYNYINNLGQGGLNFTHINEAEAKEVLNLSTREIPSAGLYAFEGDDLRNRHLSFSDQKSLRDMSYRVSPIKC